MMSNENKERSYEEFYEESIKKGKKHTGPKFKKKLIRKRKQNKQSDYRKRAKGRK